jgi:hypothetical protein
MQNRANDIRQSLQQRCLCNVWGVQQKSARRKTPGAHLLVFSFFLAGQIIPRKGDQPGRETA